MTADSSYFLDRRSALERWHAALTEVDAVSHDQAGLIDELGARLAEFDALGPDDADELEVTLRHLAFLHHVLGAPFDFRRRFAENRTPGGEPPPAQEVSSTGWRLLGYDVGYPLGVPASALTAKASWIEHFSRFGFNVFTYKTVRSEPRPELPFPNWVYLENLDDPLPVPIDVASIVARGNSSTYLSRLDAYSTANSFGVPSASPDEWKEDVKQVLSLLSRSPGKLLIVSVMGTHEKYVGDRFVKDFADAARHAVEAGAPAVELNVSCPNKVDIYGAMMTPICEDPAATRDIVRAVRAEIGPDVPLVLKLSYLDYEQLEKLLPLVVDDIEGISGINTLQVRTEDPDTGEPTFQGTDESGKPVVRSAAGLSGVALRYLALDFVESLNRLRRRNGWTYDILAMGGVMDAHDVRALRAAGADCVQTATAAATNPALPLQMREEGLLTDGDELEEVRTALFDESGALRSPRDVAETLGLSSERLETTFPSRYDLPRFVAEIVALRRAKEPQPDTDSEADRRIGQALAVNGAMRRARRRHLLDSSLSPAEAAAALGVDHAEFEKHASTGHVILVGRGAAARVPTWQFTEDRPARIVPGAAELARVFPGPPAALSAWVQAPHPDLDDTSPLDALLSGEKERVLALCEAIASAGR